MPKHTSFRFCKAIILFACLPLILGFAGCASTPSHPTPTVKAASSPQPASREPSQISQLVRSPTVPDPTYTPIPIPTPTATAIPKPSPSSWHLVYAHGSSIMVGDWLGREAFEIAQLPRPETFCFQDGRIASTRGRVVQLADLNISKLQTTLIDVPAEVLYSEMICGQQGNKFLWAGLWEQGEGGAGRGVTLSVVTDSGQQNPFDLKDAAGVRLLYYDDTHERAWILPIAQKGEGISSELWQYDTGTGQFVDSLPLQIGGEVQISPNGRYLATERQENARQQIIVVDLTAPAQPPKVWQHPEATHSVSHLWSPDSRYLAFLLRDGTDYEEATQGLGVWVLDLETMQAQKLAEEDSLASRLLAWMPTSEWIAVYSRAGGDSPPFYLLGLDGQTNPLALQEEDLLLGWSRSSFDQVSHKLVVDAWEIRFLDAVDNPDATAHVVASWLHEHPSAAEGQLQEQLRNLLNKTGWRTELTATTVKRLADDRFAVQLPPLGIYIMEGGTAQAVATGQVLLEARQEGDDIGLVYGMIGASGVQPMFTLLHKTTEGTWVPIWNPQGMRGWVTTDGEIHFVGEGLSTLKVVGSSFGMPDTIFDECHACLHRKFVSIWVRRDKGYERLTRLEPDAPAEQVYWEMCERTPYALLHEAIRRLRAGQPLDELVEDEKVIDSMRAVGLDEPTLRLRAERETEDRVEFVTVEGGRRFHAIVRNDRIVLVEEIDN